ncbi:hypothetical protein V8G54_001143 [Vigna mungo]|uniref:Glutaredoxin domain-containing protein n=1 Tax=Vigna mungo TaxID=3915 RepID=A0AAQ3S7Y1_VIGMU
MATSLSNMFFKGLANRSFGRPLNGLFYCTRYSTTVSNDSETHDDFKPANKLEGSGISLANVIEQDVKDNPVMVYMKGVPDLPQCGFSSLAVRVLKHYDVPISARNILEDVELKNAVKAFSFSLLWDKSLHGPLAIEFQFPISPAQLQHYKTDFNSTRLPSAVQQAAKVYTALTLNSFSAKHFFNDSFTQVHTHYPSSLVFSLFFPCSNWPTFPQIFIKGEFIGGSDIILNMHQTGELKEKLKDITSKK